MNMEESEETSDETHQNDTVKVLNDLPDELLLHILSFLTTLDAVQTSLISRKWRPLWSRVPFLNFYYELFPPYDSPADTRQFFAEFVDRVLILRANAPAHTFRLSFIYQDRYGFHVDSWVRSAITHLHARELSLDFYIDKEFHSDETRFHKYDFPFAVLRNGCVRVLRLTRCDLTLPSNMSAMRLWSIASMVLDQVCLTDQIVKDLILGCPNLESLELQYCWGQQNLKICSARLKKLALGYYYDSELKETVVIDCPNLCFLSIICCRFYRFVLKNASSLVEFHIDIVHKMDEYYDYWCKVVRLLKEAPSVKHLNVQNWWFKFLTSKDPFPKSFMLHSLNLLELRTGYTQYDLVGMAALLALSPNLKRMILEYLFKIGEDESLSEELLKKPVEFSMPSLKQVTMTSFTGTEDEVNFVNILKKQGVVLEKIIIVPVKVGESSYPPVVLRRRPNRDEVVT